MTATSSSPRTARELLADFREVEENFRKLDRQLREKIAGWHGGKGELLDDVLGSRESIAGSDQGRVLPGVLRVPAVPGPPGGALRPARPAFTQLDAIAERDARLRLSTTTGSMPAERTQATVRLLSEQLRRFLDDQVWFENRRVIDILRSIEAPRARAAGPEAGPDVDHGDRRARAGDPAAVGTAALHAGQRKPRIDSGHRSSDARRGNRPLGPVRAGLRGSGAAARRRPPGPARPAAGRRWPRCVAAVPARGRASPSWSTYLSLRDEAFAIVFDDTVTRPDHLVRVAMARSAPPTLPRVTFTAHGGATDDRAKPGEPVASPSPSS